MESTAKIYGISWTSTFFLLLVYLPSTAKETLKTPSEYSVDFNRRFQGFSMANLETGFWLQIYTTNVGMHSLLHNIPRFFFLFLEELFLIFNQMLSIECLVGVYFVKIFSQK